MRVVIEIVAKPKILLGPLTEKVCNPCLRGMIKLTSGAGNIHDPGLHSISESKTAITDYCDCVKMTQELILKISP